MRYFLGGFGLLLFSSLMGCASTPEVAKLNQPAAPLSLDLDGKKYQVSAKKTESMTRGGLKTHHEAETKFTREIQFKKQGNGYVGLEIQNQKGYEFTVGVNQVGYESQTIQRFQVEATGATQVLAMYTTLEHKTRQYKGEKSDPSQWKEENFEEWKSVTHKMDPAKNKTVYTFRKNGDVLVDPNQAVFHLSR